MIKGMNHVGISVSDLDRSIKFYGDAFGMELVAQIKFESGTYEGKYQAILGLKGATGRAALIALGSMRIELFEFSDPEPKRSDLDRPVCDHGITHFCVEVADIDREYDRLKAIGVSFHCPPQRILGRVGRVAATYGRDPDGNVFELLERYTQENAN